MSTNKLPVTDTMNLTEVAERVAVAKKIIRECLEELEEAERKSSRDGVRSKDRNKLEARLRELEETIRPMPGFHNLLLIGSRQVPRRSR